MTFNTFKDRVAESVQNRLPDGTDVCLRSVTKNNDTVLDGLVITQPGSAVSPTIYLNNYYDEAYRKGISFDAIVNDITAKYLASDTCDMQVVSDYKSYEKIRNRIVFRIVNRQKNTGLLAHVPHVDYLDLAITFLCLVEIGDDTDGSILIRNEHLAYWDVTVDQLISDAMENTPKRLPAECKNMAELLDACFDSEAPLSPDSKDLAFPMYVLSNSMRTFGASVLRYDGLLPSLSKRFGGDFYILPSSIHEVILIPAANITTDCDLNSLICEVNETQLAPDEYLSDHAYFYSAKEDVITCV